MLPVLPNDNGIRPAGKPDECFYCKQKIGEVHGAECPIIVKLAEAHVTISQLGSMEFNIQATMPFHWELSILRFHRNESSWCQGNMTGDILLHRKLIDDPVALQKELKKINRFKKETSECMCGMLRYEPFRIVDSNPRYSVD